MGALGAGVLGQIRAGEALCSGPLVVERWHEVLVTARADRGALEPGDQAHGGCRAGGKLGP